MIFSVVLSMALYGIAFALVMVWTGWSVRKHGWCRRSLRRFSYLLFLSVLAARLVWCGVLLAYLRLKPLAELHSLHSTAAVCLDHLSCTPLGMGINSPSCVP